MWLLSMTMDKCLVVSKQLTNQCSPFQKPAPAKPEPKPKKAAPKVKVNLE